MLKIEFYNIGEVRMGSPYNICHLRISADWLLNLPDNDWQDLTAYRNDKEAVALVRWDTPGNCPGFRIVVVDNSKRTIEISDRFHGCCCELRWADNGHIFWRAESAGSYRIKGE